MPVLASARHVARIAREDISFAISLRVLPPRVAIFLLRARLHARRTKDDFSLTSATRPKDLAAVLKLAKGRTSIVELGTGTGWTTMALCVANPDCSVLSFDPFTRSQRDGYVMLAGPKAAIRARMIEAPGSDPYPVETPIDLLYIDSSHERDPTVDEFKTWEPRMAPGSSVVFDDYGHPNYPGVQEAVEALCLNGELHGSLFVHTMPF